MSSSRRARLITSPRRLTTPTAPPHVGHAYEAITTDAIARFMRLDGCDVYFLTGTDEHGIKMQQTANREGLSARQLTDRNVPRFQAMVERLDCSNDDFIRTTEERHRALGRDLAPDEGGRRHLCRNIPAGIRCATRPITRRTKRARRLGPARGAQGTPVEWVEEDSYFFRLSAYQDKLLDLYARPNFVLPKERFNEVASFVAAACTTCRSRAPPSTGAFRCPAIPGTSCMCGSTR